MNSNSNLFSHISRAKNSLEGTASPTLEKETFQRSLLAAQLANSSKNGKRAGDAPPVNIGWDSHKPVVRSSFFVVIMTRNVGFVF